MYVGFSAVMGEILPIMVGLLGVYLLVLVGRRLWLTVSGGLVDCALRRDDGRWHPGLARYRSDRFEWFGRWGLLPRPALVLRRRGAKVSEWRDSTDEESRQGYAFSKVLVLVRSDLPEVRWSLAMNAGSATGLVSWLEAAPPGGVAYRPDL